MVPSGRGYWWGSGGANDSNSSGHGNLQQTGDRLGENTGHPTVQPALVADQGWTRTSGQSDHPGHVWPVGGCEGCPPWGTKRRVVQSGS